MNGSNWRVRADANAPRGIAHPRMNAPNTA